MHYNRTGDLFERWHEKVVSIVGINSNDDGYIGEDVNKNHCGR